MFFFPDFAIFDEWRLQRDRTGKNRTRAMKEAIIRYKNSKTLEILKSLARYFDFSISEKREESGMDKTTASFTVLHVDPSAAKRYKFDRNEANER